MSEIHRIDVKPDCIETILGLREGRISSEQSVYEDNLDHRWEYKDNGSLFHATFQMTRIK